MKPQVSQEAARDAIRAELQRTGLGFTEFWAKILEDHHEASLALLATKPPVSDGTPHGEVATRWECLRPLYQRKLERSRLYLECIHALTTGWMAETWQTEAQGTASLRVGARR